MLTSQKSLPSWIGCFATLLAVLAVGLLAVAPVDRGPYFAAKLAWAELLALLVWLPTLAATSTRFFETRGALFVSAATTVTIYAALSFATLLIFTGPERLHLALQVVFFLGLVLSLVGFSFARTGAESGRTGRAAALRRTEELVALLRSAEERLHGFGDATTESRAELKALREQVQYAMPRTVPAEQGSEHATFFQRVETLVRDVAALTTPDAWNEQRTHVITSTRELRRLAGQISTTARTHAH